MLFPVKTIQKSNAHPTSQPSLASLNSTLFLPLFKYYVPLKSCKDTCPDLPEGSVHAFLPHFLLDFSAPAVQMTTPALLQRKWRGVAPLNMWEKEKKHYQMKIQGEDRPAHPAFPGCLGRWVQRPAMHLLLLYICLCLYACWHSDRTREVCSSHCLLHFGSAPWVDSGRSILNACLLPSSLQTGVLMQHCEQLYKDKCTLECDPLKGIYS